MDQTSPHPRLRHLPRALTLLAGKLSGGATTIAGGPPFTVAGGSNSSALYLPAGASAQSPLTCVNAAYPTLRLFARNNTLTSSLVVQVLYQEPVITLPVGATAFSSSWEPTSPMPTLAAVAGALGGGTAQVSLRFTAVGGASEIDDVFIDPRHW